MSEVWTSKESGIRISRVGDDMLEIAQGKRVVQLRFCVAYLHAVKLDEFIQSTGKTVRDGPGWNGVPLKAAQAEAERRRK